MTSDEARELFHAALDEELEPSERAEFEQALATDAVLKREYEALRAVQVQAAALSAAAPSVDLLGSVQEKLRARSGGRFYRDRFAEQQGRPGVMLWATVGGSLLIVVVVLVYLAVEAGMIGK